MKNFFSRLLLGLLGAALFQVPALAQVPNELPRVQPAPTNSRTEPAPKTTLRPRLVPEGFTGLTAAGLATEIPNVNVSNLGGNESEVSIAVNPTNRNNQVIAAHSANFNAMNTFFTTDGGLNWTLVPLAQAQDGNPATFRFDPTVTIAGNGNVYVSYGIDDGVTRNLVVARSTDGGATYPQITVVATNPSLDKWIIGTGPDATVAGQFNVYLAYRINAGSNVVTRLAASFDQGLTFPTDVLVSTTGNLSTFGMPAVGPNGELYVVWDDQTNRPATSDIRVATSLNNGATFGPGQLVATTAVARQTNRYPIPAQPDRGILTVPSIAVDRSGGPNNGRIYVAYTTVGAGGAADTEITVRSSDNQGATWSAPVLVNTDGGVNSQFLPWLDVDQVTGQVVVVWYDARNDPNNRQVEVFLGHSSDGGASFTNVLVSDNPSDQSLNNASRTGNNFLEYIGVASWNGVAFPVWADNSGNLADLDIFSDQIPIGLPPVAIAGADQVVECTGPGGTPVTLNGAGSSDPNGDALTFTWLEGAVVLAGPTTSATANVVLPTGAHTITLQVEDGNLLQDTDEVLITVVDTTIPVITLLGDPVLELECGVDTYTEQGATVADICDAATTVSIAGTVDTHSPGTYLITYTATDASGNAAVPVVRTVTVVDTTPPVITVLSAPTSLWSPNHKYFSLSLSGLNLVVTDLCDADLTAANIVIASAWSDEPEDAKGGGDGSTLQDIVVGAGCRTIDLRAERLGGGNGRVYTINLQVTDASGNVGTASYQVHVPANTASGPWAIADASQYTVTAAGCTPLPVAALAAGETSASARRAPATSPGQVYALNQNVPNPFSLETAISYTLPEAAHVNIRVYNLLGREVARLVNRRQEAGQYELNLDGARLSRGTYIYVLEAGNFRARKQMVLVR